MASRKSRRIARRKYGLARAGKVARRALRLQAAFYSPARPSIRRWEQMDLLPESRLVDDYSRFWEARKGLPSFEAKPRSQYVPLIRTVLGDTRFSDVDPFTRSMQSALPVVRPSLCDRRSERREVLFARRLTGKGASGNRTIRPESFIRCGGV